MEQILINDHKKRAELHLKELNKKAEGMTALLRYYNSLPVLNELKTEKQIVEFLTKPVNYLDASIINDTGATFSEKAKPLPEQVAKIFNIPYIEIVNKIYQTRISHVELMQFDLKTLTVSLKADAIQNIYENFKEYTQTDEETKLFKYTREFCDQINKYCEFMNIDNISINEVARALKLETRVKPSGKGYQIAENPVFLKDKAKRAS